MFRENTLNICHYQIMSNNVRKTVNYVPETSSYKLPFLRPNLAQQYKSQKSVRVITEKIVE